MLSIPAARSVELRSDVTARGGPAQQEEDRGAGQMRAILIDPEKQTISEIELDSDDYREIETVRKRRGFTHIVYLRGTSESDLELIYARGVPDADARFWFEVDAGRCSPSCLITGPGLVLSTGIDRGGRDVSITIEELRARITFTQRKFRGYANAFDMIAPIIDVGPGLR